MVCHPVPKSANDLKIAIHAGPQSARGGRRWPVRKSAMDVGNPDASVMTRGEHALPEGELEFSDHLAGGRVATPHVPQVSAWTVATSRVRKASFETRTPWPAGAVNGLQRVCDGVTNGHFREVRRQQHRAGDPRMPGVEIQAQGIVAAGGDAIRRQPGRR